MEKKTILAVILSALIIIGYQFYITKYFPAPVGTETKTTAAVNEMLSAQQTENSTGQNNISSASETEISNLPEKIIEIETDKYVVTLSSIGGCIKSIRLKEYSSSANAKGFDLIDITNLRDGIFNIDSLGAYKISGVNFNCEQKAGEVTFTADIGGKIELIKKYIFHNSLYAIDLELYVKNTADSQLKTSCIINTGSHIGVDSPVDKRYIQAVVEVGGKVKRSGGSKGDGLFIKGNIGYAGLQNRYFSVIVKNNIPTEGVIVKKLNDENVSSAIKVSEFAVLPRSAASYKFSLYAGPTDKKTMEQYSLSSAANYGVLGGVSDILLAGLKLFHKVFRNWGIAVILLSILVNIVLFPLSRKSYESMKKMQHIQPHMDKLREEHKGNPSKLNKEMMELYKKYDVNPMGGCLPLLLQIPIFIALYQALMKSLELRGSGFLWVKDLSMPDAVPIPFSLPIIGNTINVLPILMTIGMVFQQKFSTPKGAAQSAQQKQQQQMMIIMPVVFLFVMYSFPSGLVLYWLINTILTMFEQRAIMHA